MSDKEYIEYLRNKIEELQDENTQLKIEIDSLKRNLIQYIPLPRHIQKWEITDKL